MENLALQIFYLHPEQCLQGRLHDLNIELSAEQNGILMVLISNWHVEGDQKLGEGDTNDLQTCESRLGYRLSRLSISCKSGSLKHIPLIVDKCLGLQSTRMVVPEIRKAHHSSCIGLFRPDLTGSHQMTVSSIKRQKKGACIN